MSKHQTNPKFMDSTKFMTSTFVTCQEERKAKDWEESQIIVYKKAWHLKGK
jgi:hypothetical protein